MKIRLFGRNMRLLYNVSARILVLRTRINTRIWMFRVVEIGDGEVWG